jgi:hypothetical protein
MRRVAPLTSLLVLLAGAAPAADQPVPYPEGYRGWYHVKSMLIGPEHALYDAFGGIHHIYANPEALKRYRGGSFPDGAVIVFDLLAAQDAEGAVVEGPRKVVGVMRKDGTAYAGTGGWGFEGFKGDSSSERVVGAEAASACFACHAESAGPDFVFSTLRP